MADPTVLASASIGSTAAGSILGAAGAKESGEAQGRMYDYQAGVAQLNKQIAEQNRDYAVQTGEREASIYGMKARQQAGAIRARQGGSGLSVNFGSAVDVQESQAEIAKLDLATIRRNAARTAYGYTVEATQDEAQSQIFKMAGANARRAGSINAAASLISGAGSVSSKWLQAKQTGVPGF